MRITLKGLLIALVVVAVAGGGSAIAAATIGTSQIKNNSVRSVDVRNGTLRARDIRKRGITADRLSNGTRKLLFAKGEAKVGPQGPPGPRGPAGPAGGGGGGAGIAGPQWGAIDRNIIGSPDVDLRTGPYVPGGSGNPPFGVGSLGFSVKDGTEKAAFGNEVDFRDDPLSGVNQVGFRIFQTRENTQKSSGPNNLPSIAIE